MRYNVNISGVEKLNSSMLASLKRDIANSVHPDQTPHQEASILALYSFALKKGISIKQGNNENSPDDLII